MESDEDIIARKARERELAAAWKEFRSSKAVRKAIGNLPSANPVPHPIIVPRALRRPNGKQRCDGRALEKRA